MPPLLADANARSKVSSALRSVDALVIRARSAEAAGVSGAAASPVSIALIVGTRRPGADSGLMPSRYRRQDSSSPR